MSLFIRFISWHPDNSQTQLSVSQIVAFFVFNFRSLCGRFLPFFVAFLQLPLFPFTSKYLARCTPFAIRYILWKIRNERMFLFKDEKPLLRFCPGATLFQMPSENFGFLSRLINKSPALTVRLPLIGAGCLIAMR